MNKIIASLFFAWCLCDTALAQESWQIGSPNAVDVVATRTSGTLTFSGTGNMKNFIAPPAPPWILEPGEQLTTVIIGERVTGIGENAFPGCGGITSIRSLNPVPPAVPSDVFRDVDKTVCALTVPTGSEEAYRKVPWLDFFKRVTATSNTEQGSITGGIPSTFSAGTYLIADYFTPDPQSDYRFVKWTLKGSENSITQFTVSNTPVELVAHFTLNTIVTVTPVDTLHKTYGDLDPDTLAYTYTTNTGVTNLTFTGALSRTTGENVGPYRILKGTLSTTDDYEVRVAPDIFFHINKKDITITGISALDKVYDGTTRATMRGTPVISGLIAGDNVTIDYGNNRWAEFADSKIGNNKPVTFYGFLLSNTPAAENYTLFIAKGTANIIEAPPVDPTPPDKPGKLPDLDPSQVIVDSIYVWISNTLKIDTGMMTNYYTVECGATKAVVTIKTANSNDKIEVSYKDVVQHGNNSQVNLNVYKPGIYTVGYAVNDKKYSLMIESFFLFDSLVAKRYDNVLLLKNNTGYKYATAEWFIGNDEQWESLGTGLYYSAGNNSDDVLDATANYKVVVVTDDGRTLHSCPSCPSDVSTAISAFSASSPLRAYPNPVSEGKSITIEGISEEVEKLTIYDLNGRLISTHPIQTGYAPSLQIPIPAVRGMYIIRVGDKMLKLLVE
ncbi:hypothetical protein AGMMS49982_01250 [Bacteroidia bacterium]|nr:hypothetical protein AGMMS49982_01250 [Bacteroidia bacterium]